MRERWGLIQSGQNRKDIKIQCSKLYFKGNFYGSVIDSKFVLCSNRESSGPAKLVIGQNVDSSGSTSSTASLTVPVVVDPMDTATLTPSS